MPAGGILGKAASRKAGRLAETKRHDVSAIIVRYVCHIRASSLCQTYRPIINGSPIGLPFIVSANHPVSRAFRFAESEGFEPPVLL